MILLTIPAVFIISYFLWIRARKKKKANIRKLLASNSDKLQQYNKEMKRFGGITLGWIKKELGPLQELSEDIATRSSMYLVEASAAACAHLKIHKRLHETMQVLTLTELGYLEEAARGMVAAILSPPTHFDELQQNTGKSAFEAWIHDGDQAAETHIQNAVTEWIRSANLQKEIRGFL